MEKNNNFKLIKHSNFFTSSCQNQNLSKVIDHNQTPNILQTPLSNQIQDNNNQEKYPFHNILIQPKQISSYMSPYSPSLKMCKPKSPQTFDHIVQHNYNITPTRNRLKLTGKHSHSGECVGVGAGRKCSPSNTASPLFQKQGRRSKKKNEKKKLVSHEKNRTQFRKYGSKPNPFSLSSSNETDDNGDWFSSDDEREDCEKQTMFSLKSVSFSSKSVSFSSDLDTPQTRPLTQTRIAGLRLKEVGIKSEAQTQTQARDKRGTQRRKAVGRMPLEDWYSNIPPNRARAQTERRKSGLRRKEVGIDTFAIVKSSSDPYNDFKKSMVEMIIEKQIVKGNELKHLLECFISLNSSHHHELIVEVFSEICNALFCHCS